MLEARFKHRSSCTSHGPGLNVDLERGSQGIALRVEIFSTRKASRLTSTRVSAPYRPIASTRFAYTPGPFPPCARVCLQRGIVLSLALVSKMTTSDDAVVHVAAFPSLSLTTTLTAISELPHPGTTNGRDQAIARTPVLRITFDFRSALDECLTEVVTPWILHNPLNWKA